MNGAGSCGPGPAGAAGPGGRPGANVDGGGVGPAGPSGSVRAPGGGSAGGGTGVPGALGDVSPGRPAIGMPGIGGRPFGFGGDAWTSSGAGKAGPPNGPMAPPAQGRGLSGRGNAPAAGVYEHGDPGGTAGPGCSGVPSSTGGAGGGAPLGDRVALGAGKRESGPPALRQKLSGAESPLFQ